MPLQINNNYHGQMQSRWEKHGLLALLGIIIVFAASGCRIEVTFGAPANEPTAQDGSTTSVAAAPASPSAVLPVERGTSAVVVKETLPTLTPTSAPPTATPTPLPSPTSLPTPTPLPPAQLPPTRIVAPVIGLDAPITFTTWSTVNQGGTQVSVWNVPDYAAGWHVNSALPGHGSNIVLSGHHNIAGEVFRYVVDLQPGDEITLRADGRDYFYQVTDRFILPERGVPEEQRLQNAQWIQPTVDERLTLVTCWPYTDNSYRVIVIAKPSGKLQMAAKLP